MKYAYIFDFDGVLVNTMEAHFACYEKALAEVGVPIDKRQFFSQAGMTGREQIVYFCRKARKHPDVERIYRRKKALFKDYMDRITPIECNLQLIKKLKGAGVAVAIATGSSKSTITPIIEQFGIDVDVVISAEDVERGKPNPDLFLCAARELKVQPAYCIVVEDSDVGIEAAGRAGMKAMRFCNGQRR